MLQHAGPERPNLDDCYFHRLSSCTVADTGLNATARRGAEILNLRRDQHSHKAGVPLRFLPTLNDADSSIPNQLENHCYQLTVAAEIKDLAMWTRRCSQVLLDRNGKNSWKGGSKKRVPHMCAS
jgi:hypothetical protein